MFKFFLWSDAIWRTANNLLYRLWPLWPYTILAFDRLHISPAFYSIRIRVLYLFRAISSVMIRYATSKFRVLGTIRQSVLTNCWVGKLGRSTSRGELAELGVVRKNGYHLWVHFDLISATVNCVGHIPTSNSSRCQRYYIQARRIKEATCRSLFQSIIIRGKLCWMLDRWTACSCK